MRSPGSGKYYSEGARLLARHLEKSGETQTELAERLGTSSGQLNQWIHGGRRAGLDWALRMFRVLGIPLDAWKRPARSKALIPPHGDAA